MADTHPQPHLRHWSSTGSLTVHIEHHLYRIDESDLLAKLNTLSKIEINGCQCVEFPDEWQITSRDFEALLEHIQQRSRSSEFIPDIASLLRISAPGSLDLPHIHTLAREWLESLIPKTPTPHFKLDHADEVLMLSIRYNILSIQKQLYYTIVTTTDVGVDEHTIDEDSHHPILDPSVVKRCKHLLTSLINHFTPILFTVATASHMICTDAFAENWMTVVISPSLLNDGVAQPVETLQKLADIDWSAFGICDECVAEKKVEWAGERDVIWDKMDVWLQEV